MSDLHVAQVNVALPRELLDSPALAGFVANLEPVNALADDAPGFVWRLQDESGDDLDRSAVELRLRRRPPGGDAPPARMVTKLAESHQALWWVPAGHIPTILEAEDRLAHLREHGPTEHAFTFKSGFDAPALAELETR